MTKGLFYVVGGTDGREETVQNGTQLDVVLLLFLVLVALYEITTLVTLPELRHSRIHLQLHSDIGGLLAEDILRFLLFLVCSISLLNLKSSIFKKNILVLRIGKRYRYIAAAECLLYI